MVPRHLEDTGRRGGLSAGCRGTEPAEVNWRATPNPHTGTRNRFREEAAAHYMLCSLVPNKPLTSTSPWPRDWGPAELEGRGDKS